uniref:Uncharacterized protein n=1 Tax=Timema bartmani TaxID=61472 RepID=A0A7R9F3X0_9NEOP|nr:unnamed protein product [Timema bartmani]
MAAQRIVVTEFGTKAVSDPCHTIFKRVAAFFSPGESLSDNAMISVYPFGDEFYTFTEAPIIHRIDPTTLDTLERVDVSEHVGIVNHTSHPLIMSDGTVYNLGLNISMIGPSYTIIKLILNKNSGTTYDFLVCYSIKTMVLFVLGLSESKRLSSFEQATIVATIPVRWPLHPSYMHTFGITDHYFVVVEQPLTVSVPSMIKNQVTNSPLIESLRWYKDEQTVIYLIRRKDGKIHKTFVAEAFFYLHIINQYEEENNIILDICTYRDPSMLDCMYAESLKNIQKNPDYAKMFRGRPLRFVLPFADPTNNHSVDENSGLLCSTQTIIYHLNNKQIFVKPELLCDLGCETPKLHYEKHMGRSYRYFYAISSDVDAENPGTLIKVDTVNKTWKTWNEKNIFPSEPIFVPAPEPKSEDDGVILSSLVWGKGLENQVGVIILDAITWKELARAEFTTPSAVPKCLHGWFTPKIF